MDLVGFKDIRIGHVLLEKALTVGPFVALNKVLEVGEVSQIVAPWVELIDVITQWIN